MNRRTSHSAVEKSPLFTHQSAIDYRLKSAGKRRSIPEGTRNKMMSLKSEMTKERRVRAQTPSCLSSKRERGNMSNYLAISSKGRLTPILKGNAQNVGYSDHVINDFLKTNLSETKPRVLTADKLNKSARIYPLRPSSKNSTHSRTFSSQIPASRIQIQGETPDPSTNNESF